MVTEPKHTVWTYTLRSNSGRHHDFVMIGPPIDHAAAMSALQMHWDPDRIVSIHPKPNPRG